MRLLARDELALRLYIALKTTPRHLRSFSDVSARALADRLVDRVIEEDMLLVLPDDVPAGDFGMKRGSWDVTEPHPLPGLKEREPP